MALNVFEEEGMWLEGGTERQIVTVSSSIPLDSLCGVPQGLVLGPVFSTFMLLQSHVNSLFY